MDRINLFCFLVCVLLHSSVAQVTSRSFDQEIRATRILDTPACNGSTSGNEFQKLVLADGNVFVGATNTILQLSSTLDEISRFESGPGNDSIHCGGPPYCDDGNLCQNNLQCANNHNRLLLPYRNRLIACGSLHEVCDLLDLTNVSLTVGHQRSLKCLDENLQQYVSVGSRNLEAPLVGAVHVNPEYTDRDLVYLGQPQHFIQVLYAPDIRRSYFTLVDRFIENIYNKIATYHLAWTTDEYGYVLWTNSTTDETKLSRYCNSIMSEFGREEFGEEFDSPQNIGPRTYTEISIQCQGMRNSQVVAAKFLFGQLYILYQDGSNFALCATNVTYLNSQFDFFRDRCWKSDDGSRYSRYVDTSVSCSQRNTRDDWISCGLPAIATQFFDLRTMNVVGLIPVDLDQQMMYRLMGIETATTFTISLENDIYVVFVGTTNGNIFKFRLTNDSYSVTEKLASGNDLPILDSMFLDKNNENLFTMSNNFVYRVRVADCSQYTTCNVCVESRDPYCGWCVQEAMCTKRTDCPSIDLTERWIGPSMTSNRCPRVSVVEPSIISVGSAPTKINLTMTGTALSNILDYACEFKSQNDENIQLDSSPLVYLSSDSRFAICYFPTTSSDLIPATSDHVGVTLRIVTNNRSLASGSLRVFQCSNIKTLNPYSMCSSCVTSEWGCTWCAGSGTCNTSPDCFNQLVRYQTLCPTVTGYNLDGEAFIAAGRRETFFLETNFLPGNTNSYMCQYKLCGRTNSSNAIINPSSEVAECIATAELLRCDERSSTIQVFITRGDYIIDPTSVESVSGKLYNCSAASIRDSCTRCMGFRRECDQCVWCPNVTSCVDESECPSGTPVVTDIEDCEAPMIESISPVNGPFEGGTYVTITGRNLGSRVEDISTVRVGAIECEVVPNQYDTSRRIVCVTGVARSNADSGPVTVITTYEKRVRSSTGFQYRSVATRMFTPNVVINQTLIEVSGRMLSVGNSATLYFEGSRNTMTTCINRQERRMSCQLPPVTKAGNYSVYVRIDGFVSTFSSPVVQVAENPIIAVDGNLVGFKTAGGTVSFNLSSLTGVHSVTLQIGTQPEQNCTINQKQLSVECIVTPLTPSTSRQRRQANTGENDATITVNGVYKVPVGPVTYHDDPALSRLAILPCNSPSSGAEPPTTNTSAESFPEPTKTIQIPGNNFYATKPHYSAYRVTLSSEGDIVPLDPILCNVTFIESSSLFCRATSTELTAFANRKITINVRIGELNLTMPNVQYCAEDNTAIIAIAITLPIVVSLLLVILVLLHRQRMRIKKQAKERALIMKKLDDLENKTREHARNAYYELQVGYMNNLSDNINRRITYRRPELYFIQTLFNLAGDHPVLDNAALKQETATLDAIEEWTGLIKNKEFLMTFIRTLEEQKKFTVQEKGNVASLLVVCLFSDMAYFTNIMFELLTELIQKHIQKNPKLLLRRSESVVEKMVSHWLSITLYDECINGNAGEPIFLLTKAIHYLVSSAPCDVIAHKSVNSLNESTLLGSEIRYSTKLLTASIQEGSCEKTTPPIEVSVVDVDTITQVKQKIIDEVYKDKPYSECPKPDDFDFELLCNGSMGEGIVLSDIDPTSERTQNFTKLNTIKHYNVNDRARVVLRPVGTLRPASPDSKTPLLNGNTPNVYHLIDEDPSREDFLEGFSNRPFQEIFLTRMVRSKSTLQEYVDCVFKTILSPEPIPLAVRFFFQFLDREAARHRINDDEVVHIWKTNSLLLRYWVNVLKNPEFIFDINKTPVVDSCLSVITQAFMDACSTTTSRKLNYDSPSNKLLYAKDAEHYQKMVNEFFLKISNTKWIPDEEINQMLNRTSQQYAHKFNPRVACQQLYQYLFKYKEQIITAIRNEENEDLAKTVERVSRKMEGRNNLTTVL